MIEIVPYQERYFLELRRICLSTAEKRYRTNEAICWMFLDYYLEYEPENVFVAIESDVAVGYIVCSTNQQVFLEKNKKVYLPKIASQSLLLGLFFRMCLRTSKKLNHIYNGGFHMNVDEAYQGQKIGPKLLDSLAAHLRKKGFSYMHLVTKNRRTRGYGFYRHYGFYEGKRYFSGALALIYNLKK